MDDQVGGPSPASAPFMGIFVVSGTLPEYGNRRARITAAAQRFR